MMIDKQSPVPIYFQLEEGIRQQIETGDLKPGDALPSEREYAEMYNISRMTVRQAINNLVNDGYLHRQRGKGSFVADKKFEQQLQGLTSFTEDMLARGIKPSSILLSFQQIVAPDDIVHQLKLRHGDTVWQTERLRLADDVPIAVEVGYFPVRLFPNLTQEIFLQSLYQYVETENHYKIDYSHQVIEASIVAKQELDILMLKKGSPVLRIERLSFLTNGEPFEIIRSTYRADKYKFYIDMKR